MTDEELVFNKLKQIPFMDMMELVIEFKTLRLHPLRHLQRQDSPLDDIDWDKFLLHQGWDVQSYTCAYSEFIKIQKFVYHT
jgi:hypothetical protein